MQCEERKVQDVYSELHYLTLRSQKDSFGACILLYIFRFFQHVKAINKTNTNVFDNRCSYSPEG